MIKFIKSLFGLEKNDTTAEVPYKVEAPAVEVQPAAEVNVNPVSVALDLEPVDVVTAEPAKKPRKPRAPKAADAKPAKKPAAKAAVKPAAKRGPKAKK